MFDLIRRYKISVAAWLIETGLNMLPKSVDKDGLVIELHNSGVSDEFFMLYKVIHEYREIGEGDWITCDAVEYMRFGGLPEYDTKSFIRMADGKTVPLASGPILSIRK